MGGIPIYTPAYTFCRDLGCQLDSAAASKTSKKLIRAIKGRDTEADTCVWLIRLYNAGGVNIYYTSEIEFCQ